MKKGAEHPYILVVISALSALLSFVTGIWIRNILGPEDYGTWLMLSLILMYGYYTQLGMLESFSRDVPRLIGQGDKKGVQSVRSTTLAAIIFSMILCVIGIFLLLFASIPPATKIYCSIAFSIVPLQNFVLYCNHYFLTIQQYKKAAVTQLLIGSVQYVLMALMSMWLGIYGLFTGVIVGCLMAVIYSTRPGNLKVNFKIDRALLRSMITYGIKITFIGVCLLLLTTIDRIVLYVGLGSPVLGQYGITIIMFQAVMVLPAVFHQIIYPKMNYIYGHTGLKVSLYPIIKKSVIAFSALNPLIIAPLYFFIPWLVHDFMPEYAEGIMPAKIIICSLFFYSWALLIAHYFTVIHKERNYLFTLLLHVGVSIILNVLMVYMGYGMNGVALASSMIYVVYPFTLLFLCLKDMKIKIKDRGSLFLKVISPFGVMVLIFGLVYSITNPIISTSIFMLIYIFFLSMALKLGALPFLKKMLEESAGNLKRVGGRIMSNLRE
ncbi:oligosaccharide flippase family protein [Jeotgalibacillus salarius]|uniref:Uncharacterized protein n=1 Tax=Jeotgalibacillus salarius TaxID=546023 RepID=A0A4Y8LP03_9BACL|nr:oligosaccharide flippase family protein [Jeotgalibacillus salarius]TFE04137.1 hypothetical protein E2626_02085 [Jeotgalibacillus salarius]